jgi:hypothetical protein
LQKYYGIPALALVFALGGCFETSEVSHPSYTPADVVYETNESSCDPSESFHVDNPHGTEFDSVQICVTAGAFKGCDSQALSTSPYASSGSFLEISTDRFAGEYEFTYRVLRKGRIADSGSFPVRGKTRAEVERMPGRIVFYYRGDSLTWDFHREDSSYWSGIFQRGVRIKAGQEFFLHSTSGIDSAVITGLPRVQKFTLRNEAGSDSTVGFLSAMPFTDRYRLVLGNKDRAYVYYAGPRGELGPTVRCFQLDYVYGADETMTRKNLPDLIPDLSLGPVSKGRLLVFDARYPGRYFLCDFGIDCEDVVSP